MFSQVTHIAHATLRNKRTLFGIKQPDRLSHTYIIGKTGTGKSSLLFNLIKQDIEAGRGLVLLDPHGDLANKVAQSMPQHRRLDMVYFNTTDPHMPYGCNPLRYVSPEKRPLVASGVLEVFKKLWSGNNWGVNMEHILRNCLLALLEVPHATLVDIPRLLTDKIFREEVIEQITNPQVKVFWGRDFSACGFDRPAALSPVLNKVGAFLADPMLYRVLTASEKPLSFRSLMDQKKVLVVNLAKGQIGEDASSLLGGLLVSMVTLAAFSRADVAEEQRTPFFLYADEFQNFATESFADAVSELRKYGIGLILAHQHLHQVPERIHSAILGNVGTLISFRVGAKDAPYMAREFHPVFSQEDIAGLPNYQMYLKLMIDGVPSKPFSAETMGF
ncbi:type IV secretory system conjugative DNA transfer family protein [Kordiimonas pumila]|uniref:Type IV secretory system conjugative DNA transfer family protein n=1 Tax=Kordiimonas pumila TaxID=2161677 RepID=A0ABV7D2K5_9PROT|nr:TraM recognition domain-containing protein [Kordiimonas pumila]